MAHLDYGLDEKIKLLGEHFYRSLSPFVETDRNVIQKGLILYRQNMIYKITMNQDKITATVQDVVKVKVELDLHHFFHHTCTCPSDMYCRHQLAVFFYMYSHFYRVTEWVDHWREPFTKQDSLQNLGLKRASDLLKTKTKQGDYDEWVKTYHEIFQTIFSNQNEWVRFFLEDQFTYYSKKVLENAPLKKEWKNLYILIAYFHSFILLKNFLKEKKMIHEWEPSVLDEIFSEIIMRIQHQINQLHIQALPFAFDQFIEKMRGDVPFIFDQDGWIIEHSFDLYLILWKRLFTKKEWREQEIKRLKRLPEHKDFRDFCLASQYLLLKQDEKALTLLQQMGPYGMMLLLHFFIYFVEEKDWKRIGFFLDYFIHQLQPFFNENEHFINISLVQDSISLLQEYMDATGQNEIYEKFLIEALPYSFSWYRSYLFKEKQYKKWADLYVLLGYDIEDISQEEIKILEKEAPEILFPFYHQAVEENIEMRNRGNYRVAVRYLKKLKSLYKKQKRLQDWEYFLNLLMEKTKRLRAFQEEVVRGKLIEEKRS